MDEVLAQIEGLMTTVKTNFQSFDVLQKSVDDALAAKETGRVALIKVLQDAQKSLADMEASLGPIPAEPAPVAAAEEPVKEE